jgi:hypothetical protein
MERMHAQVDKKDPASLYATVSLAVFKRGQRDWLAALLEIPSSLVPSLCF